MILGYILLVKILPVLDVSAEFFLEILVVIL
jgi:hypothetical protein